MPEIVPSSGGHPNVGCCGLCCVVSCRAVALLLSRLADVQLFRLGSILGPFLRLFRDFPHSLVCALPLAENLWVL